MDAEPEVPTESPMPSPKADLPNVPVEWPGAFALYKYSRKAVLRSLGTLVVLYLIDLAVSGVLGLALKDIGRIIGDIVSIVISVALYITYLASIRGQKLSVSEAFSRLTPGLLLRYLLMALLYGVIIVASLILLIVPFFFVLPRLLLSPYFVVDKELGPLGAIKASWQVTAGNVGKIWGVIGAGIAMMLLCLTIIGIPFAIYFIVMYSAAPALLYEYLTKNQPEPDLQSAAPATDPISPISQ